MRLQQLGEVSEEAAAEPVSPPIEFPPLANYTVGDALVHVATHNSHHLGLTDWLCNARSFRYR